MTADTSIDPARLLHEHLAATTAGVRLPATLVFDHPTPAVLAEFLLAQVIPAAPDPGELAVAELDRMEALLSEAGDAERDPVRARMAALLEKWSGVRTQPVDGREPNDDLQHATEDTIFDLIDNELEDGVAPYPH